MRKLSPALLAAVAATVLAGSGAALAQTPQVHVMRVAMPNGGVAEIQYTGNVAPQVAFTQTPAAVGIADPFPSLFGPGSPFAEMQRISAAMDRQADAMLRDAATLSAATPSQLVETAARNLPPGSSHYSFVSTMSGNGVCSQSVEITATGNGPPKVVRHSSGNCGAASGGTGSASLPVARPPATGAGPVWTSVPQTEPLRQTRPDMIWTSAAGAKPYAGLVREIPSAAR